MMNRLETAARQDIPDLIAGALGVSRGTAYDMMREALAQQAAEPEQQQDSSNRSGCTAGSDEECTNRHCATKCPALAEQQVAEPVAITEAMAFAFHSAITDGALGSDDLMDIMRGLEAAFAHITGLQAPTQEPLTDKARAVIDAARAAMNDSFEAGNDTQDISIPAHLAAALSLRLDELDGITGSKKGGAA